MKNENLKTLYYSNNVNEKYDKFIEQTEPRDKLNKRIISKFGYCESYSNMVNQKKNEQELNNKLINVSNINSINKNQNKYKNIDMIIKIDRIFQRGKRIEKGGVVDLTEKNRQINFKKISKLEDINNSKNTPFKKKNFTNNKVIKHKSKPSTNSITEDSLSIKVNESFYNNTQLIYNITKIQNWWRLIVRGNSNVMGKIIKIQAVFKGFMYRQYIVYQKECYSRINKFSYLLNRYLTDKRNIKQKYFNKLLSNKPPILPIINYLINPNKYNYQSKSNFNSINGDINNVNLPYKKNLRYKSNDFHSSFFKARASASKAISNDDVNPYDLNSKYFYNRLLEFKSKISDCSQTYINKLHKDNKIYDNDKESIDKNNDFYNRNKITRKNFNFKSISNTYTINNKVLKEKYSKNNCVFSTCIYTTLFHPISIFNFTKRLKSLLLRKSQFFMTIKLETFKKLLRKTALKNNSIYLPFYYSAKKVSNLNAINTYLCHFYYNAIYYDTKKRDNYTSPRKTNRNITESRESNINIALKYLISNISDISDISNVCNINNSLLKDNSNYINLNKARSIFMQGNKELDTDYCNHNSNFIEKIKLFSIIEISKSGLKNLICRSFKKTCFLNLIKAAIFNCHKNLIIKLRCYRLKKGIIDIVKRWRMLQQYNKIIGLKSIKLKNILDMTFLDTATSIAAIKSDCTEYTGISSFSSNLITNNTYDNSNEGNLKKSNLINKRNSIMLFNKGFKNFK